MIPVYHIQLYGMQSDSTDIVQDMAEWVELVQHRLIYI